jgi:hypothetical protein
MKKTHSIAIAVLLSSTLAPLALAQSTAAAKAARLQRLQQQQAAVLARAKAAQAAATGTTAPTAAPTTTTTTAPTPVATTPTAAPTVTAAPTATAAPKPSATAATSASAAPATSAGAAPVASALHPDTTAIALDIEALRKSRPERRHAEFVDMQSRWGGLLTDPRSADELKLHAQRFAYLQRIRALGAKDPAFVKTVDALITKEETRDSDALNALRSGALPTAAPAVAAPAAGATK